MRRLIALAALLLSVPARAQAPPGDVEALRDRIAEVLRREEVPGAGIALVAGDRILYAGGVGLADVASGRPVTADTMFRVGSITKSFVSLAAVRLAEKGLLRLDRPVADYAPELDLQNRWAAERPITIAHVLEHTAGFDDMRPSETVAPPGDDLPLAQVLAKNPRSRIARWRPGSRFSYANPGTTIAAYVLEKVTGLPYEEVLAREVLRPLGMVHASLRYTPETRARMATGYDDRSRPVPYVYVYHRPAGNLMASPRELAELVKLDLARGRPLVSPESFARTERGDTSDIDSGAAGYGLGNYGDVWERALIRGHGGGIQGFISHYGYLPDCGVGYVVLLNSHRSRRALVEIRHLLVEHLLAGVRVPDPPPPVRVPEAELARLAGVYHAAATRHTLFAFLQRVQPGLEVFVDGGRLYLRGYPEGRTATELLPLGEGRFRSAKASAGHLTFRVIDGVRVMTESAQYFEAEPAWVTALFYWGWKIAIWILATGIFLPLSALRDMERPGPGFAWPLAASLSLFAMPRLLESATRAHVAGTMNVYTVGICVLGWTFAAASLGCAVHAFTGWKPPVRARTRLYHRIFAVAACAMVAFLGHYKVLGVMLWRW